MNEVAGDKAISAVEMTEETAEQERWGISFEIKDVSVSYGGILAINGISLEVAAGERIGILGNNGAGKTTVCDVLSGLILPQNGNIKLRGKDITKRNANWRARKGFRRIFENPVYFEDLSLEENVLIGSPPLKGDNVFSSMFFPRLFHKERRETARRIMEYCNIDVSLSGRNKVIPFFVEKRIELARALMGNPRVLVIDELSSGLDEEQRAKYCQVVIDYVETFSTTLVVVETDADVVRSLCDRAIALDSGEVIADGEVVPVLRNTEVMKRILHAGVIL